jgi:hypothetical protein
MPYLNNFLSELRLANFKAFSLLQRIPLRPITLIYGPNGSGKSSILEGLRWAASLADGSALNLFDRIVRFHDAHSSIDIGVDMTLSGSNAWDSETPFEFRFLDLLGESIRTISIDATVSRSETEVKPSLHLMGPRILRAALEINGQPLVTWTEEPSFSFSTDTLVLVERQNALCIATLNCGHPFLLLLLREVKLRCLEILTDWEVTQVPDMTDQLSPAEIEALRYAIESYDLGRLSADSLLSRTQSIRFTSNRLFPIPIQQDQFCVTEDLKWISIFKNAYRSHLNKSAHDSRTPEVLDDFFLERFRELLVLFFAALNDVSDFRVLNDPLRDVTYVPAIRSIPAREFLLTDDEQRTTFAPDWKIRSDATGAQQQISEINAWLAELRRIDTNYEISCELLRITLPDKPSSKPTSHLRFLGIRDKTTRTVVSLSETGTGFSQLLPVLLASFFGGGVSTCIQQPELHLHPALQAELGDLFVKRALQFDTESETVSGNQFLIETHSEHLLLRIMRRIRETKKGSLPPHLPAVTPNDVSVLYVEPAEDGSIVRTMPLSEDGDLLYDWPGGFFEEGLREVLM